MALKAIIGGSKQAQHYIEAVALSGTMSGLQYCKYSTNGFIDRVAIDSSFNTGQETQLLHETVHRFICN